MSDVYTFECKYDSNPTSSDPTANKQPTSESNGILIFILVCALIIDIILGYYGYKNISAKEKEKKLYGIIIGLFFLFVFLAIVYLMDQLINSK